MIRYFLFCLALLVSSAFLQQCVPSFTENIYNSKLLLVPLVYFCIALAQPYASMLFFAVVAGALWDCENILSPFTSENALKIESVENLRFGYSIFLFGILGILLKYAQAFFAPKGLRVLTPIVALTFILYLLAENLLILFIRGTIPVDHKFLYQIFFTTIYSCIPAPFVLLLLSFFWKQFEPRRASYLN